MLLQLASFLEKVKSFNMNERINEGMSECMNESYLFYVLRWGNWAIAHKTQTLALPPNLIWNTFRWTISIWYRCKKERSLAFKIRQNAFTAGTPPQTPLGGAHDAPQTSLSVGERTPSPYTTLLSAVGTSILPPSAVPSTAFHYFWSWEKWDGHAPCLLWPDYSKYTVVVTATRQLLRED